MLNEESLELNDALPRKNIASKKVSETRQANPEEVSTDSNNLHCKCLQGIAGTLQGNLSAGISKLQGLQVYP